MNIIELKNVGKVYAANGVPVEALSHVSLSVESGCFLSVIGQSGSGKSTLMNILGCLDRPTYGSYRFEGKEMTELSRRQLTFWRRDRIGFIFQNFHLISGLTALENVMLPLYYQGCSRLECQALAEKLLNRMHLEQRKNHFPRQLSGGQQQRIAIARALITEPSVVLADEPTGNLDSASGNEVLQLLQDIHHRGKTVILITHDEKIAQKADRTIKILDGTISFI